MTLPFVSALSSAASLRLQRVGWISVFVALLSALAGCDQLGLDTPAKAAERKLAEAKAIGSACRHAMRAIEDCYVLNPKADKSAVFSGWREMDEYMRENKLEGVREGSGETKLRENGRTTRGVRARNRLKGE